MSKISVGHSSIFHGLAKRIRNAAPYLFIPVALVIVASFVAFRHAAVISLPDGVLSGSPLVLPAGWPMPPIPADNPITNEKFVLGRQLFYEVGMSHDGMTSCGTCHNSFLSFSSKGPHVGSDGDSGRPFRNVPRLVNVAYDSVLTWDGHIHTLEDQVKIAIQKKGDLLADTNQVIRFLSNNPAYNAMFTQAFGSSQVTMDRIAMAVATFERCLISGNSPYDKYLAGDSSEFTSSMKSGMNLFFDTNQTKCAQCHNNLGTTNPNAPGNTFSDGNYYRTGTFEFPSHGKAGGGGYGFDTTADTIRLSLDAGRASVTRDTADVGKFRTPTLRNVCLTQAFGADATISSLAQLLSNYNAGGTIDPQFGLESPPFNKDPRIKPLKLGDSLISDLAAFINSLTDLDFISNPAFHDPGPASIVIDDRIISGNLSTYPNPASDFVNVDCPDFTGITEASLISERGVTVWQQTLNANGRLRLDLSNIMNGIYRLQLSSGATRQAGKIVIQR